MALPRWLTKPVGVVSQQVGGAYDYLTPGAGKSTLTNAGDAIVDPNRVYAGAINPFGGSGGRSDIHNGGQSGFVQVSQPSQSGQVLGANTHNGSQTQAPNNPYVESGGGSSGADLAYLDTQESLLRNLLGKSQTYLDQGLTNLSDSYNRQVSDANQQRSRALEDFGVKNEDTTRAKQDALGRVDTNARTLSDSLRRILGMAGGSSSSAYELAAPNAVARQASQQRAGVLGDYGANERDLSLAQQRAEQDFGSLLANLSRSRNEQEQELRSGVLENNQDTLSKLATVAGQRAQAQGGGAASIRAAQSPFLSDINNSQTQLDSLFNRFRNPTFGVQPVQVDTPQLRDYTVDRAAINANTAAPTQSAYSPYSNFLRRPQDDSLLY